VSLEYTIICDKCGRLIDASRQSAAAARASVRDMGGVIAQPGGKDFCNQCARELPPETPETATAAMSLAAGIFGTHQRWHVRRGERNPACRHCAPEGEAGRESNPRAR
jgi:hypothetical protein